ncbi:MAG: hypothetical protein ABSG91_02640 [Syntrophobacteraceae bacterium]|jgi:hypothetical protein
MRIDETLKQQAIQESQQSTGQKSVSSDDAFALLLQSEISGSQAEVASDSAVCGLGGVAGPLGIQSMIPASAQTSGLSQAISALDSTLTQFDSLISAIQENKSPREINSLIEQINAQTAGLDDKMSGLPADHQLRDMAEELKVTAYMESLKWRRGDYL